jgi:DhnA family fructose-bisphosphate aldolase class Ia
MSQPNPKARFHRLFGADGKCFDVAIDHGFFNQFVFLPGIEDLGAAVRTVVEAGPDAIQLTTGQARLLQQVPGRHKPSLVLRVDIANIYGQVLPTTPFSRMIDQAGLQAVQHDAACVCVNLFQIPGASVVHDHCVENILRLKTECDRLAMPMMIEPLVFRPNEQAGGYMVDGDEKKIIPLVRQAVELGADIIKADPTDDVSLYHRVVEVAGDVPVLVRGGGRVSDEEILARTVALMEQGVAGIVYGRNIVHHPQPKAITRALMAIVHDGATVEQALRLLAPNGERVPAGRG